MSMDIFLAVFCIVIMAAPVWGWLSERKRWNEGVCPETGEGWEYFDTDSQGGRGYKSGDYTVWISWPGIDK